MNIKKYILPVAVAALLASCSEDPVLPPVQGPVATMEANTTILELKQTYWQSGSNYVATIGTGANGEDLIIKGIVISSDETGNIYKSLMINDGTAALTIAVNAYDLYQSYQYGQEVFINVTGLKIGGYNNLMQLGGEGTYNNAPSMTFMDEAVLTAHAQQNGFGDPANVEKYVKTATIAELQTAKNSAEGLQKWQSQLVRLEGVSFEDAGQPFAATATTNRYVKDAQGNRMNVRCSSYATFHNDLIPAGVGNVTAILSYYGSDWQMLLIDLGGLEGFDGTENPDTPDTPDQPADGKGTKDEPYTVPEVIALGNPGTTGQWVSGYIVGVMNYIEGTGNIFSTTELTTNSNIVIAATAEDYGTSYVAVQLPTGDLRTALNLVDHPELMGKEVSVCGDLIKYCNIAGVKNTSAAVMDGKDVGAAAPTPGEGDVWTKATAITSGQSYVLWSDNMVSNAMSAGKNYSYLLTSALALNADGTLTTAPENAYTFTETAKGWTIQDANGVYLYMQGSFNSFQLSASLDESNAAYFWQITPAADGRFEIVNADTAKLMQLSLQYKSYGAYENRATGSMPYLYKK